MSSFGVKIVTRSGVSVTIPFNTRRAANRAVGSLNSPDIVDEREEFLEVYATSINHVAVRKSEIVVAIVTKTD